MNLLEKTEKSDKDFSGLLNFLGALLRGKARLGGLQLLDQVGHLDGTYHGVEALVAAFGAGTFYGLLDGVCCENAQHYWYSALYGGLCDGLK